jgi:hypothetical protein
MNPGRGGGGLVKMRTQVAIIGAVLPGCWSIAPAITALPMSFRALKAEQQDIDAELSAASDVDTITWRARDDLCWVETRRQFMGGWTVEQAGYLRAPI